MKNPITGEDLSPKAAEYVEQLRAVRRGARKMARSGHPGRRADGQRVLAVVPGRIAEVYRREVSA